MTKLERIDTWLIEVPYQGLVDWSQRKPAWWAENAALAFIVSVWVLAGIKGLADPLTVTIVIVASMWAALVVATARSSMGVSWLAAGPVAFRHVIFILSAICVSLDLLAMGGPLTLLRIVNDISYPSVFYFAACNPPRPKRRTQDRLATAAGGA